MGMLHTRTLSAPLSFLIYNQNIDLYEVVSVKFDHFVHNNAVFESMY
jgi:hypothetical protein